MKKTLLIPVGLLLTFFIKSSSDKFKTLTSLITVEKDVSISPDPAIPSSMSLS